MRLGNWNYWIQKLLQWLTWFPGVLEAHILALPVVLIFRIFSVRSQILDLKKNMQGFWTQKLKPVRIWLQKVLGLYGSTSPSQNVLYLLVQSLSPTQIFPNNPNLSWLLLTKIIEVTSFTTYPSNRKPLLVA